MTPDRDDIESLFSIPGLARPSLDKPNVDRPSPSGRCPSHNATGISNQLHLLNNFSLDYCILLYNVWDSQYLHATKTYSIINPQISASQKYAYRAYSCSKWR